MSDETKVEARKKLDAITDKIGYPNTWRDYSTVIVKRDDLLGNVIRSGDYERKRNLAKFGKPVDPTERGMTPPTVNAYYNEPQSARRAGPGRPAPPPPPSGACPRRRATPTTTRRRTTSTSPPVFCNRL